MSIRVIVNPAAGGGRGRRRLPAIRAAFAAHGIHDLVVTRAPGEEADLAGRAVAEGVGTIVAAGGDGTWSNVAGAVVAAGADTRLALLATGTGNDFATSVGAPAGDPAATADLAVRGPDVRVDVGCVGARVFINVLGFGFDCAVLEELGRMTWPGGRFRYAYAALRQLFRYRGLDVALESEAGARGRARYLLLVVANARRFGGAFHIAPAARLTDGRLDVVAIGDAGPAARARLFVAAARGTHVGLPGVSAETAPSVRLRFDAPPAYHTDGEYRRAETTTLDVRCLPRALRVVVPTAAAIT